MPPEHYLQRLPLGHPWEVALTQEFFCLTFELFLMKWLFKIFYRIGMGKKVWEGGGLLALGNLLTLKK
jgi:hypothetical protein